MPSLKPYRSRAKILADHAAFEIGMNKVRAKNTGLQIRPAKQEDSALAVETIGAHLAQWRDFRHNLLVASRKMH